MMFKNKKLNAIILSVFVLVLFVGSNASATVVNFNITAGGTFYSNGTAKAIKTDNLKTVCVNWQASSRASHVMWFRVINSEGAVRGEARLNYKQNKIFSTTAQKGYYYWLQAKREYPWDPSTNVTGRWEP